MRHLNVKWLPETFAIFSLTVAPAQETAASRGSEELGKGHNGIPAAAPVKVIVISGGRELCAAVTTGTPQF
jgi:hypothetical protein